MSRYPWISLLLGFAAMTQSLATDTQSHPLTDAEAMALKHDPSRPKPTETSTQEKSERGAAEKAVEKRSAESPARSHNLPLAMPTLKPQEIVGRLIAGNGLFTAEHSGNYFAPFARSQAPKVTLLTCSDSRVQTDLFGTNPDNFFFTVRDIGNQMQTAQGSVDYGIQHLGTPILMIVGHVGCGAVKAAMGSFEDEDEDIKHELEPLVPALTVKDGAPDEQWAKNVQANVDYQVRQALAAYRNKIQDGSLTVLGAIYDFQNLFGKGFGTLVIVNANGETLPSSIKANPVFSQSGVKELEAHVGRF